jgi:hypothetical protein
VLAGAACAEEETSACASEGVAEFCIGPRGEIRGSGFEPGTTITATGGFEETVTDDGWFPGTIAYLSMDRSLPDEIVVEGTRKDGEDVRLVLEDPKVR